MYLTDYKDYFYLRSSKPRANGQVPIYLRIERRGKRKDISTRLSCRKQDWDSAQKRLHPEAPNSKAINASLSQWRLKIQQSLQVISTQKESTLEEVREELFKVDHPYGVIEYFKERIEHMESLVGRSYRTSTLTNYRSCLKHLEAYILIKYHRSDRRLKGIDATFLHEWHRYLCTKKKCQTNTANKYLRMLRAVLNEALRRGLIEKNPFGLLQLKEERRSIEFLFHEELERIRQKPLHLPRLALVRDLFVLACFTGLSYADVRTLTARELTHRNGQRYILKRRIKSGIESIIPLFEPAEVLIERYGILEDPNAPLFPTPSNQKLNAYLKEIGTVCDLSKELTFHMARHTFATTVCLGNGVPMESVSKMLGHRKITTTQIYAQVMEDKLFEDTLGVSQKYGQVKGDSGAALKAI